MNPSTADVEALKATWTDKFVRIRPGRPELARFGGRVGKVITVNFNGKAIIDFCDGGWYDVAASERFLELVSADDAKGKYDAKANRRNPCPIAKVEQVSMILIIDNYDSFTYNLVQRLGELDGSLDVEVIRNDAITVADVAAKQPTHIIVSPGPCTPREAGVSNDVIQCFAATTPILGVCLGHQCIGQVFGGNIVRNYRVMHGKTSPVFHDGRGVFSSMSNPFEATRYHSLVIDKDSFKHPDFEVTAWTAEGEIMGVRHRAWPLHGVQFHPESFLTVEGPTLLRNFIGGVA